MAHLKELQIRVLVLKTEATVQFSFFFFLD